MGNCASQTAYNKQNGSAFDRVTSRTSTADDCLLYQLADYQKGGDLITFFNREGVRATEELLKEQMPLLLYNKGEGQVVTRVDYLKWKYRGKGHVAVPMDEKIPDWKDHKACWNFEYRGSLGESLLHVLIVCNSSVHSKIARMLVLAFPNLALDVVEGNEFRGASALHLAIAYNNLELIKLLVEAGAPVDQRAVGTFFLPKDQQRARPSRTTDYEGLAYFGEFPLAWAACCNNESAYNLLIDRGADPNAQDSFGNMVLHMVVVCDKLEMYGYALRHPRLPAKMGIVNKAGLTPLTLSCHLGRATIFREMLELTAKEFWRYSNITCSAYPLNALDTILPDGRCNLNSALMIILNGTKEEHLDMLDGGIIQRLLEEKWKTFARIQFLKRLGILFFHLFVLSGAVYCRPAQNEPLVPNWDRLDAMDYARFTFEIVTCLSCIGYVIIQQSSELKNLGLRGFLIQLSHNPAKAIFLVSNLLTLSCIPCRLTGDRDSEEAILILAVPSAWFFLMFFAGAVRLTGPFVTMIYSMITGDMLTFVIIYAITLLAFSQAFFFLHRGHPDSPPLFNNYLSTWMGLFHWTLGDYNYGALGETVYPPMTKIVFVIFMIMVPILLLNMLIAMMGNTYAQVIQQSEKEWVKQWAKIVIALERAVNQANAKEYLVSYSIKISGGSDGSDGTPPQEEVRGVMVIKSKNKTRARQRKGALGNWKRVGRVTINELKRRGIKGEHLRRQIWDPRTPSTTSPNASTCVTPVPCPTSSAAMLLMDLTSDLASSVGGVAVTSSLTGIVKENNVGMETSNMIDNAFAAFGDLSNNKKSSLPSSAAPIKPVGPDLFNTNLISQLAINSALDDVFEATTTPPVASQPKESQPPKETKPTPAEAWPPLPPLPPSVPARPFTDPLLDNSAQLSDLENEIIAQTLLGHVLVPQQSANASAETPTKVPTKEVILPPLFQPRLMDDSPILEKSIEMRRQSTPNVFQHFNSLPESLEGPNSSRTVNGSVVNLQPKIVIDLDELNTKNLARLSVTKQDSQLLAAAPDPSIGKSVHKPRKVRHQKRQHFQQRTNVVAPSFYEEPLPLPGFGHESCIFQRLERGNTPHLARSTTMAEDDTAGNNVRLRQQSEPERRHSDNESLASSSGGDDRLSTVRRVSISKPARTSASSNSPHNTSSESNPPGVFHISGSKVTDEEDKKNPSAASSSKPANKSNPKRAPARSKSVKKSNKPSTAAKSGKGGLEVVDELPRPLSSTRITEAKANHFHSPTMPAVMNLNHVLEDRADASSFDA